LAYPLLLAIAGGSALALLVGVVLPRFATILADLGQSLPPTTRAVLIAANVISSGAIPALFAMLSMVLVWRAWTSTTQGRRRWHEFLLALPIIGRVRRSAGTAHTAAALASLLDSGVALPVALTHAARATGDGALDARLLATRDSVLTGQRLGVALGATDAATPTAIRLIRAGEDTGRLVSMLRHAAKLEGERAQQAVKSAVRILEPALIITFGAMIAFVAAALLQAVYSVRPGM
jgi:type II secretory pathway component PulF